MDNVIKNLRKNNINVISCATKEEIPAIVESMLFEGAILTAGGSESVKECGVWDFIQKPCYRFYNRLRKDITEEEREQVFKAVVGSDFYFCSANAITENGEIVNVDGLSNRVSAIAFGPKKVIMVVGKNKIVKDLNEAFLRVKKIAAPKNCVRLGLDTPCAKLGHCVSLLNNENPAFADGCQNPRRICTNYLVSAQQSCAGRLNVILCDEDLGY